MNELPIETLSGVWPNGQPVAEEDLYAKLKEHFEFMLRLDSRSLSDFWLKAYFAAIRSDFNGRATLPLQTAEGRWPFQVFPRAFRGDDVTGELAIADGRYQISLRSRALPEFAIDVAGPWSPRPEG